MAIHRVSRSINCKLTITFFLLPFFLGSLLSSTLYAQDRKRDNMIELMDAMGVERQIEAIFSPFENMISYIGANLDIQQDEQPLVEKYKKEMFEKMQSRFSWQSVREEMIEIYQSHYTDKEILDLLAFYKTESGIAMLEKGPQVQAKISQALDIKMRSIKPKIEQLIKDFAER